MATYYFRPAIAASGTLQIGGAHWSTSSLTTPGAFIPSTGDFTSSANEFIIDQFSGGTFAAPLIINVGSNMTIANLSFGGLNTSTSDNYATPIFNVAASVILTISGNLKLPNNGAAVSGGSGLYLNTNTTGKIFVTGNFLVGANHDLNPTGGICPIFPTGTPFESVIEIGGTTFSFIRGTASGSPNTYFKVLTDVQNSALHTGYTRGNIRIKFTKSSTGTLSFLVDNFLFFRGPISTLTTVFIESDYDSSAKTAFPTRYGSPSTYGNGINIPSIVVTNTGVVNTDLKELGVIALQVTGNGTNTAFVNSISSLKIGVVNLTPNITLNVGGTSSSTTVLEVLGSFNRNLGLNNIGTAHGAGTIKFVGTLDSIINVPPISSTLQGLFSVNVEIAKTGSAKVTCSNTNSDFLFGYYFLPFLLSQPTFTFTHTSGIFECTNFYTYYYPTSIRTFNFIGNSNTSVTSITNLYLNTGTSLYTINTNPLKVTNLYIQGISNSVINNVSILGNRGFTVDNFYHTTTADNALNRINSVTLSNDPSAVYTVNNSIEMLGLSNRRAILKGDLNPTTIINLPSTSASINTLTTTTSPALTTRHYISQNPTSTGLFKKTPSPIFTGSDITQQSSFAKINGGSTNTWTLNRNVGTITSRTFQAGIPAVFRFTGNQANLNINYVETIDIDSSGVGTTTIKADNSYQNRLGIPNPNLWRTINWDSLNPLLPNVIEAYVE